MSIKYPATFQFDLGDRVTDRISKVKGIITTRLDCINGCNRYYVQPESEDGKLPDAYVIDEHALDLNAKNVHTPFRSVVKSQGEKATNGPMTSRVARPVVRR